MFTKLLIKKLFCLVLLISSLTPLTGCMTASGPNEMGGRLAGGVAGALIGSQFGHGDGRLLAVGLGALAGSFIGGELGARMDHRDRQLAKSTVMASLERAPDYQTRRWRNPNNNHCGSVQIIQTTEMPEDFLVCRDYVHTVIIDGRQERIHGRACRDMRDTRGQWFVDN